MVGRAFPVKLGEAGLPQKIAFKASMRSMAVVVLDLGAEHALELGVTEDQPSAAVCCRRAGAPRERAYARHGGRGGAGRGPATQND
jgi:hypothetical protein